MKRSEGSATIVVLMLVVIIGALLVASARHLASVRRELRLVEERQKQRWATTNAPPVLKVANDPAPIAP